MTNDAKKGRPMQSIQERVLTEIETRINDAGFDAVQRAKYANTGTVLAMLGLRTRLVIGYSFQDEYCSLTFSGNAVRAFHAIQYSDADRLEAAVALVQTLLTSVQDETKDEGR